MKVLVSGSTGLVGTSLVPSLASDGHQVVRLVRTQTPRGEAAVSWDPAAGRLEPASLEGLDAVVHLAGESIAKERWSNAVKTRIRSSRVDGTRLLSEALAKTARPPRTLVCASAVGYYGSRGAEILKEDHVPGDDFLARVCREWEAAAEPARRKGIGVLHLRFGFILSPAGGGLAKMLPPFKLGLGGPLGDGAQYMSWVTIDDAVGAIRHVLANGELRGPVNVVAPAPVTNREFTATLGRVLSRPVVFPMPAFVARLVFGEMADALLLASQRVQPARLLASGYRFRHAGLEDGLRSLLGRPAA
jgi:hypothetical protein